MEKGSVKWFNAEKGYGFITVDGGDDIFVHYTKINTQGYRTLEQGQIVEFEIFEDKQDPNKKGPQAINVTVVDAQ